jgi:hypothetical protein
LAAVQTAIATPGIPDARTSYQLGTIEMPATEDFKHASPPRHPCCAGPDDSNPVAFATHAAPAHRPGMAMDDHHAATNSATGKGEGK